MKKIQGAVVDRRVGALSSVFVTVYNQGTANKPTIYSDNGITPQANPFQTDSLGRWAFYVADGHYDIQFSGSAISTFKMQDILIGDFLKMRGYWVDVRDYDSFASAVAALPSGGTLLLPIGTYNDNLVLSGKSGVVVRGMGVNSVIQPSSGIAISAENCPGIRVRNLQTIGGINGLAVHGANSGLFEDLIITTPSGDGIFIDGDDPTEIGFLNILMSCGENSAGFHYLRTTTNDTGGIYLHNVRAHKSGAAAGQVGFKFNKVSGLVAPLNLFANQCIADGYLDNAWMFQLMLNYRLVNSWAYSDVTGKGALLLDNCDQGFIDDFWASNVHANGSAVEIAGGTVRVILDNIGLVAGASGFGILMTGISMTNIRLGKYQLYGTVSLSNDLVRLAKITGTNFISPLQILVDPYVPASNFGLFDVSGGANPTKFFRIAGGEFEVVNNAYTAVIFGLTDGGDVRVPVAGKGMLLKNAAGTIVKRARLNDAGNGLIYENE